MKISRFIVVALFGLGLISQNSFSYDAVNKNNKMTHKKMAYKKITPNKKVAKATNKKQAKVANKKQIQTKLGKKHVATCGQGCRRSIFPLFNRKENRTCICPKVDKNMPAIK